MIEAEGEILCSEIHEVNMLIWGKEEFTQQQKEAFLCLFAERVEKVIVVIIDAYHSCKRHTKFYQTFFCVDKLDMQKKLLGNTNVDSDRETATDQIFYIRQILEKKWENKGAVRLQFIDFKKAYYSVRREVLHNILIEFGIPKRLVGLIEMCTVKNLFETFLILNDLKQSEAFSPLLFIFFWNALLGGSKRTRKG
jgi:hypothetical protein